MTTDTSTAQHSPGPWRLNAGNETEVCSCGRGYRSAYDGKCGHCRTTREQKTHQFKLQKGLYLKMPDLSGSTANALTKAAAPELLEALRQSTLALADASRHLGGSELIATNIQIEANRAILARIDKEF